MTTNFRIALISDEPYLVGLLKGYCHAHRYKIFETAADLVSLNAMVNMQPNIIILAVNPAQGQAQKTDVNLIRKISLNHQIPVCYLRDKNNAANLKEDMTCWVDAILDLPLDVIQLDNYLLNKFQQHHHFIQEKRSRSRRAAKDRRLLMLEAANNNPSANNITQNSDADYFTVEPFHIDQRSKCVFFNGKSLNLTRKEFDLFELLAKDVDRVFMTDEIISHVWSENNRVTKSDLYQYMHLLRKKIEHDPNNPQWILTVKGFGYKLNVTATAKESSSGILKNEDSHSPLKTITIHG